MSLYPRWDSATGPVKCRGCKEPIPPGADLWIKACGVYYCNGCGLIAESTASDVLAGGIEESILSRLEKMEDGAADDPIARTSLYMARQLDAGEVSPREITQYTKEIRVNLLSLADVYSPDDESDDTASRQAKLAERRRREQQGM
jgi:hypothetical protein